MKRFLLAALAAALVVPATASACSCVPPGDAREEIAESDAAMFGKVVRRTVVDRDPIPIVRYRVRVKRDYKDNLGRHFSFRANTLGASCGLDFDRGERFGALLDRADGKWSVGLCSLRTRAHLDGASSARASKAGCAQALA